MNKSRPKQVMFRLTEEEAKELQKKIGFQLEDRFKGGVREQWDGKKIKL